MLYIRIRFLYSFSTIFSIDSVVTQNLSLSTHNLTHCGRVTQICVFTLQLCKTDDANLRF